MERGYRWVKHVCRNLNINASLNTSQGILSTTVAQGFCFTAKDSSAGNMRQNNSGIVLLQERLGTKEPALFPPTTSSF